MVKLNKIYTRTGDDGTSGLVDGTRRAKCDPRFEAIGAVDDANCAIGLLRCAHDTSALSRIQNDLFDLGADFATPGGDFTPSEMVLRIVPSQSEWLEREIDAMTAQLAPLNSFILPAGTESSARAHLARASVRRAERAAATLHAQEPVNPAALAYINRLSDYLFCLARMLNDAGNADVKWVPGQNRS